MCPKGILEIHTRVHPSSSLLSSFTGGSRLRTGAEKECLARCLQTFCLPPAAEATTRDETSRAEQHRAPSSPLLTTPARLSHSQLRSPPTAAAVGSHNARGCLPALPKCGLQVSDETLASGQMDGGFGDMEPTRRGPEKM